MAATQTILSIDYHTDDETGSQEIGDLDFSYGIELEQYIEIFGRENLIRYLRWIADKLEANESPFRF